MSPADNRPEALQAGAQPAEAALPCVSCGYDLRGLARSARCPECGADVGAARAGDQLQYADRAWVRGLVRGCGLISVCAAIMVLSTVASFLGMTLLDRAWIDVIGTAFLVVNGSGILALIAGAWIITAQEPRVSYHESETSVRRLTRLAAVLALLTFVGGHGLPPFWDRVAGIAFLVSLALTLLGCLMVFRRLSWRMPREIEVAIRFRRHFRWALGLVVVLVCGMILKRFGPAGRTWMDTVEMLTGLVWLAMFITLLRILGTVSRLRNAMIRTLDAAAPAPGDAHA